MTLLWGDASLGGRPAGVGWEAVQGGLLGPIEFVEVAPRDGLQNDPGKLTTGEKAELVLRAVAAGARRIEATSFVSPRAVPVLADADRLCEMLRDELPEDVVLAGLVVNERGVMRAATAGIEEVDVVVVCSDLLSLANQRATVEESLARLPDLLAAARAEGLRTSVTIAAAFGCPFEGEVPIGRVVEVAAAAAEAGADEISLADTIGVAVPSDVVVRVGAVGAVVGAIPLRAHFHDTHRTGMANAWAAHGAGVAALDASLGGIGGCPFTPGASGNIATEDLVYLFERSGMTTGFDLPLVLEAVDWLEKALGHHMDSGLHRAGPFPSAADKGGSVHPGIAGKASC